MKESTLYFLIASIISSYSMLSKKQLLKIKLADKSLTFYLLLRRFLRIL